MVLGPDQVFPIENEADKRGRLRTRRNSLELGGESLRIEFVRRSAQVIVNRKERNPSPMPLCTEVAVNIPCLNPNRLERLAVDESP